ncbi:MAG: HlyD family secretion protein [Hydrocarboniphaga sp.]|uniref:efflux RND transporter periplasmic adaptor subunit n=1 Tax=Hydrocarboniphaga sp. TaxID=2033016 RepID=UPI00260EF9A0|nr:efflux RND transporter periplasmic adaptor subunit [Hydrocarboniphaga sp.]MDB5972842.1 HlyD family secretion protein [Hydrocarboniphaga sp.]
MNAPLSGIIRDTSGQDTAVEKQRRRWLPIAGGVLVALVAVVWAWNFFFSGAHRSIAGDRLRIAKVALAPFVSDLSAQGRVVAAVSPTLYAPALGTVTLKVAAGQSVNQGQLLATLDSPEVTNEYAREDSNLQGLRATLAQEGIDVETSRLQNRQTVELAKVGVEGAERELKRAQDAHQLGVLPVMEVDRRADELRVAQVKYAHSVEENKLKNQSLDFQLQSRRLEVERQKLNVDNLHRRVDELNVIAPVSGVIGTLNIAQRAAVAANAPLMTVVDLSRLEVDIQVPETYADSLGIGMPAEVLVGSKLVRGHLTAISPEVNNNIVTGRVAFDDTAPPELRQNQRISVRIVLDQRDAVLQLPRGSFIDAGGGRYAYVVRDGLATRTAITVGAVAIDRVEITAGLQAGDEVVVSGDDAFESAPSVLIR